MDFRRRDQRDERRRRVLLDEMRGTNSDDDGQMADDDSAGKADGEVTVPRTYSEAALVSRQPAVTCVVPRRLWTLSCLFLMCLVLAAGVEALYVQLLQQIPNHLRDPLAALDATAPGSLASWLSSLLLFTAASYALLVFHLRRHKLDDFRARYRIWIPAAIGLLLASLDAATGLHNAAAVWLVEVTQKPLYGDGTIWWLLTIGAVFSLLAIRIAFELRESRLALGMLLTAALGYTVAAVMELGLIPRLQSHAMAGVVESSVLLASHICTLFSVLSYVRFVYLDSQGELRPRQQAKKEEKQPVETRSAETQPAPKKRETKSAAVPKVTKRATIRVDQAHDSPRKATATESEQAGGLDEATEDSEAEPQRKMSKAERRRQRKLMRQQKRS